MSLQRQNVVQNERVDAFDFDETNRLGMANLALALRAFLAPMNGVVRGLHLSPGGGLLARLSPGAAIADAGPIILETDFTVGPFAPNSSGFTRLDLVSIGYAEQQTNSEMRVILNPISGTTAEQPVLTKVTAQPVVTVTQGVPSASPVLPATPLGQIALYQVRIDSGATDITFDDITVLDAGRIDRLRWVGHIIGSSQPLPYVDSNLIDDVVIPEGGAGLVVGVMTFQPTPSPLVTVLAPLDSAVLSIENAANPGVPLSAASTGLWSCRNNLAVVSAPRTTLTTIALLLGPLAATTFQLRLALDQPGTFADWTDAVIASSAMAVLVNP